MRKRATSAQGETTPGSEGPCEKCLKQSGLNEEVQKIPTIVTLDSPKRASDTFLDLDGAAQDASREACASLEDGIPACGAPN